MVRQSPIYLLYSCDQWCSHSSMALITATTSKKRLVRTLLKKIEEGDAEFQGMDGAEGVELWRKERKYARETYADEFDYNQGIKYAFVDTVTERIECGEIL